MTAFDFRAASSYAAALAVAIWSTTMIVAATATPAVTSLASVA